MSPIVVMDVSGITNGHPRVLFVLFFNQDLPYSEVKVSVST